MNKESEGEGMKRVERVPCRCVHNSYVVYAAESESIAKYSTAAYYF
jgi:hypothetical protein